MADYEMSYDEIEKQRKDMSGQLDGLESALKDMTNIESTLLEAGQWQTKDKEELMKRFKAYVTNGTKLREDGVTNTEILGRVAQTYRNAEQ